MSLRDFIRENRDEIEAGIRKTVPNIGRLTLEDLRQWVLNDEGLYNWARSSGVRI